MVVFKKNGFALVEILIAVTILSIVLLSVFSGVSTSIKALSDNKNYTIAMLLARTKMNEFISNAMRGPDLNGEPASEYQGFTVSRETRRYEHPLLGPLPIKKTDITIKWRSAGLDSREKSYRISYIYASQ